MTVVQTKPDFFKGYAASQLRVARLERISQSVTLKDINTSGLSSAQIDAAVFGDSTGAQPSDGLTISDSTNHLLLVRQGGKWCKTAALTVIP